MKLSPKEARFLTALAREQNQSGCRGPAHDLLRRHAYPDAPRRGPGSLAFAYEAVPLSALLFQDFKDLQEIDDFLRQGERIADPEWPWSSAEEYRARLEEARREHVRREPTPGGSPSQTARSTSSKP
jgi:hypothetical protein